MYLYIVTLILLIFKVNSSSICDSECVCRYNKSDQDLHGENVDCSYNPNIFESNNLLPTITHSLDLSTNNLTRVKSSSLLKSKTMIELYLNNNEITIIDDNAFELPELKTLDLSNNQLEAINGNTFQSIRKLEYLNLANNRFTTFEKLTFHNLGNLNEIILDNNKIGYNLREINIFDRKGFGLTCKIKTLSLSGIGLNIVQDSSFIDAYDLKKLIISNNNLTDTFQIPYTLQYFDISDNPIKEIVIEDFLNLPGLKTLKLNNLNIQEVDDYVFSPLHSLIHLELERNKNLTKFSALAFGQEAVDDPDMFLLETLSLKGSRVTTLDEQLLEPFGQLIRLDLQGNPWKCDCNIVWLKKLQIQPNDYDHLRCALPSPLFNSKIFELDAKYFTCPGNKHLVGLTIAAVSFCVILAAIALWFFLFLPRYQTRCHVLQSMYASSAAYSVLPTAN